MVPVPAPPLKRRIVAERPAGGASAAVIWLTPFAVIVPTMLAVGVVRLIAPRGKADWERYLKALAALLESSLNAAVAYRAAGIQPASQRPARARTRPAGVTRPGGKPGVSRAAASGRRKH